MILPIRVFGDPILRARARPVSGPSDTLRTLITDMTETMHHAQGIGLASPQVGRSERVFLVDLTSVMAEMDEEERVAYQPQPMVFINPKILWDSARTVQFEEGCLSIPDVREDVMRPESIGIEYHNQDFVRERLDAGGILARVIQHEYDHLDGVLFVDLISSFRRSMLKRRLRDIAAGIVEADYPLAVQRSRAVA